MKIVVALGGNALLERGEKPDADIQAHHVRRAAKALAPLVEQHDVVITHGNGPQVGVLALESEADAALSSLHVRRPCRGDARPNWQLASGRNRTRRSWPRGCLPPDVGHKLTPQIPASPYQPSLSAASTRSLKRESSAAAMAGRCDRTADTGAGSLRPLSQLRS